MLRSLVLKLVLAFLFVSLAGVWLVAFFVGQRTQTEFERFVVDRDQEAFVTALTQHYQAKGNWDTVETVVREYYLARQKPGMPPMSVVLVNAHKQIVLGRGAAAGGERVTQSELERGLPLEVDGQVVGWLLPGPRAPREWGGWEQLFLERVNQAILLSALGATAVALILGVLLARTLAHPIRELTAATQAVAKGELGRQVVVRSHDELGELAASFNQMSADLAQASALRRQMMADIAHELRTPLSLFLGYTEALSDGKLQGTPETFDMMYDEAKRLKRLVDDLRTLSLADAGELPLIRRPVPPQELLEHVALAYMAQAMEQKVSLQVQAASDLPAINVDRDRMTQVLGNLVSNALRYTSEGGYITLSAGPNGSQVWLAVHDSGAGIAPEDLPRVFDRFYRGDPSRSRQEEESGLGLAIAKSIVAMHGGTIAAESTLGEGSSLTVTLPFAN
ncbi:MAG: HAMP domain-containing protein [Thermoflexales bacterium]|nr:HAMP domain-containing protein [Thermoflexales bacterium]